MLGKLHELIAKAYNHFWKIHLMQFQRKMDENSLISMFSHIKEGYQRAFINWQTVRLSARVSPFEKLPVLGFAIRTIKRIRHSRFLSAHQATMNELVLAELKIIEEALQRNSTFFETSNNTIQQNNLGENYGITAGYTARAKPEVYIAESFDLSIIHQQTVYPFASYLAERYGCKYIIDIGCGLGEKLIPLSEKFEIIGIDIKENVDYCRTHYSFGQWIEFDFERLDSLPINPEIASQALIICADVIEHLITPLPLLKNIYSLLEYTQCALISTPDRDQARGYDHFGPPQNRYHTREWNLQEFTTLLKQMNFNVEFAGFTFNNDQDMQKNTIIEVLVNNHVPPKQKAPVNFRVVAVLNVFNEDDILAPSLNYLIKNDIDVFVVNNWSTDRTLEIAESFLGKGVIGVKTYPPEGRVNYSWEKLLKHTESLSREIPADWFIHYDADEFRESPWPEINLKDAIYYVDQCGFNCIDFTVANFQPTQNNYPAGTDPFFYIPYFEFAKHPAHFIQMKAWKNTGNPVMISDSAGHEAKFEGRRVYPFKFLNRHYTIRSQEQGKKKIFQERVVDPVESARGWNTHVNGYVPTHNFIRKPEDLTLFDHNFYTEFLVERLSGVGVPRIEDWNQGKTDFSSSNVNTNPTGI